MYAIWARRGFRRPNVLAGALFVLLVFSEAGAAIASESDQLPAMGAESPEGPVMAEWTCKGCQVDLVTMVPGESLFTGFGHIAFRFSEPIGGIDEIYDYGTYDAEDPLIAYNFLVGNLDYYCAKNDWESILAWYSLEFGGIELRRLNLSQDQIDRLYDRVNTDCLPENAAYRYHHFYNNCSTKIRDILDNVLGGSLSIALIGQPAQRTLRDLIDASMNRPEFAVTRWLVFGLLNGSIDGQADRWTQSFLPVYLSEEVDGLLVRGSDGQTQKLVSSHEVIRGYGAAEPPLPGLWPGLVTLLLLLVVSSLGFWVSKVSAWKSVLLGSWFALIGLLGSLYGGLILFSWVVSPIPETKSNWNLLLFSPVHVCMVVAGIGLAARKTWASHFLARYLAVGVCVTLLALILEAIGLFQQRIWPYSLAGLAVASGGWMSLGGLARLKTLLRRKRDADGAPGKD